MFIFTVRYWAWPLRRVGRIWPPSCTDLAATPPEVPVPIQRLNHAVLYVRDVDRSVAFYTEALGFRVKVALPGAAFLQAAGSTNDHDLGLFAIGDGAADSAAGRGTVGLYHLAWEVDTLAELRRVADVLTARAALAGASDGLEFEVSWLVPAHLLTDDVTMKTAPLDLDADIDRYGTDTLGGVGVSTPALR